MTFGGLEPCDFAHHHLIHQQCGVGAPPCTQKYTLNVALLSLGASLFHWVACQSKRWHGALWVVDSLKSPTCGRAYQLACLLPAQPKAAS
jgi:hypothetical protein